MSIYGYVSASTDKPLAISFANDNPSRNTKAVLYHIKWYSGCFGKPNNYDMDGSVSAYSHEKEVLINDGKQFKVLSVDETILNGKRLTLIKL
jgi:hypothetical protein